MLGRNRLGTTRLGASGARHGQVKSLSAAIAVAGTASRAVARTLSVVVKAVGTVARSSGKILSAAVKASGAVVRMAGKGLTALVDVAASAARYAARLKALDVTVTLAASMVRVRGKTFLASVSVASSVTRSVGKILAAVATVGASVKRDVAKGITATVDVGATIIRGVAKILTAGVDVSGAVDRIKTYLKTVAASVVAGVTIGRAIARTLRADVDVSGIKRVAVSRTLTTMVLASGHVYFGWFVTLTAGVVAWVDIIFGGIPVKLTATVKAGSSIVRSVSKHLVGLVKAAGSVTTFLYDAVYSMNRTVRRIFGRIRITYTDPFFSAGVTAESNGTGRHTYPIQTADNVEETAYKWFSLHRNVLDGSFHPLPGDQSTSVGWWGVELSDPVSAEFTTPPVLTVEFAERSILSLVVVGDDKLDEYPGDFDVDVYGAADVLLHHEAVTGNTDVRWTATVDPFAEDAVKQVLTIYKWSRVGAVSKIAQFFTMLEETYEGEDLVGIRLYEQREYAGASIPQGNIAAAEITVRLNNIDGTFSPGNTSSRLYEMMLNNRAIAAWLGVELYPSGVVRWYPLGVFYSRDWSAPDDQVWAEVTGLDMLDRLRTTTFSTSEVYEDKSLADLAEIILLDAGLTSADWIIDADLDTFIVPYAWFEPQSHREALRKIAQAGLGQVYVDRDGKVVVEIYQEPAAISFEYHRGNVWGIDHPLKWSEMVNRLEVRSSPRMASAEEEIVGDEEEFSINPGASVTKTHFYTFSPCVDVQEPTIEGGADITVAAWTAYAWGVNVTYTNAGAGVESVTRVSVMGKPLDVVPGRVIVKEDTASIAQNGVQSLGEPLTSEFWQDEATAQTVATVLLATYKNPRRDIAIRARGNIGQILGDTVQAPDSLVGTGVDRLFSVLSQDINWDGGLQVVLEARAQGGPVRYHKTLTAHATAGASITSRAAHRLKTLTAHVKVSGTVHRLASIVRTLFSLAGDGQIQKYGEGATPDILATVRDATTGDSVSTGASPLELYVLDAYFGGKYRVTIRRAYVYFGTTVVPSHAVVSDAKLHLFVSIVGDLVDPPYHHSPCSPLYVSDGQPNYPTESGGNPALNVIDYGDEKFTTRTQIARDDVMEGAYNVFDVLSWIRKAALTKFRLTQTNNAGSDFAPIYYQVHSSEGAYPPKLVLTYTIEEGG